LTIINLVHAIPLLIALSGLEVNWTSDPERDIVVRVHHDDPLVRQCIRSGLELRYNYQLQLCKKRAIWFDSCAEMKTIQKTAQFNPINGSYRMSSHVRGEEVPPEVRIVDEFDLALSELSKIARLPVSSLAGGRSDLKKSSRSYLSTRVLSECRGKYNRTLANLGYYLTLGLLKVDGFDTGWQHFSLNVPTPEGGESVAHRGTER